MIVTIKVVRIIFIAANVPIQVPKSSPSETLLTCAELNPRLVTILNIARKDMVNPIIPRAPGAKSPQNFIIIINSIQLKNWPIKDDITIRNDFLAIIVKQLLIKNSILNELN